MTITFATLIFLSAFEQEEILRWKRFPVCHLDDIIASKRAANRRNDRESIGRPEAFRIYFAAYVFVCLLREFQTVMAPVLEALTFI